MSELLASTPETLDLDIMVRKSGIAERVDRSLPRLSPAARQYVSHLVRFTFNMQLTLQPPFGRILDAYAEGVNAYMDHHIRPLEFFLVGCTTAIHIKKE